jgi:O-antigen/teichoic acid export membrane protein
MVGVSAAIIVAAFAAFVYFRLRKQKKVFPFSAKKCLLILAAATLLDHSIL